MTAGRFATLNLTILFLFLFCSFFGIAALPLVSFLLWVGILILGFLSIRKNSKPFSIDTLIGWIFFFLFGGMAWLWLTDIWVAPSQDDTLNHLGFLEAILRSHSALLGKIERPGADWFGSSAYRFYPTGSHALVALWIEPFQLFGFTWPKLFKGFQIGTLATLPAFCWWASVRAFPKIPREIRLFILIAAMTVLVFPLAAFGEGGFSRIFALTLFVSLWFQCFESGRSLRDGLLWSGVWMPTLLFIHPSLLPLIAVAVLFTNRRMLLGSLLGAPVGIFLFYFLLQSAQQEVTQAGFAESLVSSLRHDFLGWFDRLKGPFHYWFSDPLGYGKFLSPKNYFVYLGFGLAICGKIPRRILLLFAIPFMMAALALIPNSYLQQLGLIYYHAVKRIAELTPLLGFTIACFSASWVFQKYRIQKWTRGLAITLSGVFLILFYSNSLREMNIVNELFHSPKESVVSSWTEKLRVLGANDRILVDRREFEAIRYAIPQTTFTMRPECAEVGTLSSYCENRVSFAKTILDGKNPVFHFDGKIWWLPNSTVFSDPALASKLAVLPFLSIDPNTKLIQIYPQGTGK